VAVAVVVLVLALRPSTDDPEAAIRGYLEALRDGDLDKAYGHLCPHTRDAYDQQQWADLTEAITSYRVEAVSTGPGDAEATAEVTTTNPTGTSHTRDYVLFRQDGRWWVCDPG
jgi:hypothetical protein